MRQDSPMRKFDPRRLAHYEKQNYVAYYQKDWWTLLRASIAMVREGLGFSWVQACYAAYLMARAEIAFAPFPVNDLAQAEKFIRRFYKFVKETHREDFDVNRAAKLELNWWVLHRKLFANRENQELVDALTALYAEAYELERDAVFPAARERAMGMLCSDLWVNAGKADDSPLLVEEEETLYRSYVLLKQVVTA